MSYLVFARKYRPQRFEEVVAQEHVTRTLRNALKNDRVGSGYLFCGPRGTGKTTIARILAKSANCAEGLNKAPCGKCPSCIEITGGTSLDVLEIDAASNTGVDDIRTLRENVRYLPTGGKKRIYIIDEVHRLSASAFDALLKTLEEPPEHVMFMFATTEPLKVPETILSRTQRFDLRRVSVEELTTHLRKIAEAEKLSVDDKALNLLARKADGSVRDSLSLMDQIAAFADNDISEEDVVKALGLVDRGFLTEYTTAVADSDRQKVLRLTGLVFSGGIDVMNFVQELLEHFRVLMILVSDPDAGPALNLSSTEIKEYQQQAQRFSIGDLLRMMKVMSGINADLKAGLDERLLLEVAGVRMAEMDSTISLSEVLQQLQQGGDLSIEEANPAPGQKKNDSNQRQSGNGGRPVVSNPAEAGGQSAPLYSNRVNLSQLQAGWNQFLQRLNRTHPMLSSQLRMAEISAVDGNKVDLVFYASCEPSRDLVSEQNNFNLILKTLEEHYKAKLTIRLRIDPNKEIPKLRDAKKRTRTVDPIKLAESSPRLKRLLEKVDGEIIGIKNIE
jgi:DNA polymerase-3 subunit gamma/tau